MADPLAVSGLPHIFTETMRGLLPHGFPRRLAVAVSGGSDSMALALLAKDWADREGVILTAFTVNHGLRTEAAGEARQVKRWLEARGITTRVLTWKGPYPKSGIQEAARNARYQLMAEACTDEAIGALLLGHQLEDQLETLLMRLSKGSGLEGLAAIQGVSEWGRLRLLRPLLTVRRTVLREYLNAYSQGWIDDPSNENPVYTRTRVGAVLSEMQQLPGSNMETIALSLARLQRASNSLEMLAGQKIQAECEISPLGFIQMPDRMLDDCPEELSLRILSMLLRCVGGGQRIKLSTLEQLYHRLFKEGAGKSATIAGAQMQKSGNGWLFCREPGRAGLPNIKVTAEQEDWIWDNRFMITDSLPGEELPEGLYIDALGAEGWRQIKEFSDTSRLLFVPAKVRNSLPALWIEDKMVAAPLLLTDKTDNFVFNQRFKVQFRAFYWMTDPIS